AARLSARAKDQPGGRAVLRRNQGGLAAAQERARRYLPRSAGAGGRHAANSCRGLSGTQCETIAWRHSGGAAHWRATADGDAAPHGQWAPSSARDLAADLHGWRRAGSVDALSDAAEPGD